MHSVPEMSESMVPRHEEDVDVGALGRQSLLPLQHAVSTDSHHHADTTTPHVLDGLLHCSGRMKFLSTSARCVPRVRLKTSRSGQPNVTNHNRRLTMKTHSMFIVCALPCSFVVALDAVLLLWGRSAPLLRCINHMQGALFIWVAAWLAR